MSKEADKTDLKRLATDTNTPSIAGSVSNSNESSKKRKQTETNDSAAAEDEPARPRQLVFMPDDAEVKSERKNAGALDEDIIADHLEEYLMASDNKAGTRVYHSVLGGVHLYCFPPSEVLGRNFTTVVTMGMSGTRMKVPEDIDRENPGYWAHAELMCFLPADWPMPAALGGPITAESWPMEMLRSLVEYVHTTGAWLAEDHGVPSMVHERPGLPFHDSTRLSHSVLLSTAMEKPQFSPCMVKGAPVHFYLIVPLTSAEATWKRQVGAENSIYFIVGDKRAVVQKDRIPVDYVIDASRACAVEDLRLHELHASR